MGTWVVKELLKLRNDENRPIDPTGLIFFDTPESTRFLRPNDVASEAIMLQYLYEFADIFKMKPEPHKLPGLQSKLHEIDVEFRGLVLARYGQSVEVKDDDIERFTYTLNLWTDNIWMSPRPLLKFDQCILLGGGKNSRTGLPKKLEQAKLEEHLKRAITLHQYHNIRQKPLDKTKQPTQPTDKDKPKSEDTPEGSKDPPGSTKPGPPTDSKKSLPSGGGEERVGGKESPNANKDISTDANNKGESCKNTSKPQSCYKKKDLTNANKTPSSVEKDGSINANKNGSTKANEAPSGLQKTVSSPRVKVAPPQTVTEVPLEGPNGASSDAENGPTMYDDIYNASPPRKVKASPNGSADTSQSYMKEKSYFGLPRTPQSHFPMMSGLFPGPFWGEEEPNADISPSAANAHDGETDKGGKNNWFDFNDAIDQRNQAALKNDVLTWVNALNRLQYIKLMQMREFGEDDPRTLTTRRECILTSIVGGIWGPKTIEKWEKEQIQEIESETRQVYEGLERTLGHLHPQTLEAQALLFVVRIPLAGVEALPRAPLENIQDMMWCENDNEATRTPERLFKELRLEYKVEYTPDQACFYGNGV
ncbi:hypothetical protein F5Y13DRAFT_179083 [Hypoxylon sp. FL1857]|nr:hypothetical protein F5Y13DRAFT_179083 [Hypoxylon sp. FL1857]